jgi:hypothetical protein
MRLPKIGDIVHFWPYGEGRIPGAQPLAAVVAFVHPRNEHSPHLVNLGVLSNTGGTYSEQSVRVIQEEDDPKAKPEQRYATWPIDGKVAKSEKAKP